MDCSGPCPHGPSQEIIGGHRLGSGTNTSWHRGEQRSKQIEGHGDLVSAAQREAGPQPCGEHGSWHTSRAPGNIFLPIPLASCWEFRRCVEAQRSQKPGLESHRAQRQSVPSARPVRLQALCPSSRSREARARRRGACGAQDGGASC